jgi:hypothetical protein
LITGETAEHSVAGMPEFGGTGSPISQYGAARRAQELRGTREFGGLGVGEGAMSRAYIGSARTGAVDPEFYGSPGVRAQAEERQLYESGAKTRFRRPGLFMGGTSPAYGPQKTYTPQGLGVVDAERAYTGLGGVTGDMGYTFSAFGPGQYQAPWANPYKR